MTTHQPQAYALNLSCGHRQLATFEAKVGSHYPCWTACNPETPVKTSIVSVDPYEPEEGVAYVVCSQLSNEEMRQVTRNVHQANRELSDELRP